eukprot:gnl/Dysnectes_brevis/9608_a18038_156.p1 GENE.gnl/Dysnectes_brevis/9608_a18038_156~~gnl/Dysnectes_brevis/9608_a18038_156.p1  ORF type:complete len:394 (-),score=120.14 gnl/Dysnectes_brevis/9608_a18038_156:239-1318(-)
MGSLNRYQIAQLSVEDTLKKAGSMSAQVDRTIRKSRYLVPLADRKALERQSKHASQSSVAIFESLFPRAYTGGYSWPAHIQSRETKTNILTEYLPSVSQGSSSITGHKVRYSRLFPKMTPLDESVEHQAHVLGVPLTPRTRHALDNVADQTRLEMEQIRQEEVEEPADRELVSFVHSAFAGDPIPKGFKAAVEHQLGPRAERGDTSQLGGPPLDIEAYRKRYPEHLPDLSQRALSHPDPKLRAAARRGASAFRILLLAGATLRALKTTAMQQQRSARCVADGVEPRASAATLLLASRIVKSRFTRLEQLNQLKDVISLLPTAPRLKAHDVPPPRARAEYSRLKQRAASCRRRGDAKKGD